MKKSFRVLFYEDGEPIDPRCIRRFVNAFSKSYRERVKEIIEKSEKLDERVFKFNIAKLMPPFKMTRGGAFHGVKIYKKCPRDPNGVLDRCWDAVGTELQKLKEDIKNGTSAKRSRVLVDLSPKLRKDVIQKTCKLFEELLQVTIKSSKGSPHKITRVGASKVLFAVLPEIALPVDNLEWKHVFKTEKYREILSTMANEIDEWEKKFQPKERLEEVDPNPNTTLPAIYNVMAMSARPLTRANW
jgi:hypothetical protein